MCRSGGRGKLVKKETLLDDISKKVGRGLCSTLLLIQAQLYLEVKCPLQAVSLSCTFAGSVVHRKWSTWAIQPVIGTADWGMGQPLFSPFGERDAVLSPLLPHPQRGVAGCGETLMTGMRWQRSPPREPAGSSMDVPTQK